MIVLLLKGWRTCSGDPKVNQVYGDIIKYSQSYFYMYTLLYFSFYSPRFWNISYNTHVYYTYIYTHKCICVCMHVCVWCASCRCKHQTCVTLFASSLCSWLESWTKGSRLCKQTPLITESFSQPQTRFLWLQKYLSHRSRSFFLCVFPLGWILFSSCSY